MTKPAWQTFSKPVCRAKRLHLSSITLALSRSATMPLPRKPHDYKPMDMLNFAVASSVIKHTIHGDANIIDDAQSIRNLMNMKYDIKR